MGKFLKALSITFKVILAILVVLLLTYDICIMVQKYAMDRDMPVFFGYSSAVVVSDSMYPEICKGDLIIIDTGAEYGVGDVVTYRDGSGAYVTHRIVSVNGEGGYFTKGDNNDSIDNLTVTEDMVYGKVVGVLGGIGTAISFIQQPIGIIIIILFIALLWVLFFLLGKLLKK